uniref:Uncharacterized protein n=1 Tax=Myoviridae sp. ctxi06 TaxID=2826713 RepID=A0A8S5R3H8_9CAUD|nr:MAG TPA: hypothetical protein [Myoviridae sp. ctxi06]
MEEPTAYRISQRLGISYHISPSCATVSTATSSGYFTFFSNGLKMPQESCGGPASDNLRSPSAPS